MASINPARFLGIDTDTGAIASGLRADLVLIDPTGNVVKSWISGRPVEASA